MSTEETGGRGVLVVFLFFATFVYLKLFPNNEVFV